MFTKRYILDIFRYNIYSIVYYCLWNFHKSFETRFCHNFAHLFQKYIHYTIQFKIRWKDLLREMGTFLKQKQTENQFKLITNESEVYISYEDGERKFLGICICDTIVVGLMKALVRFLTQEIFLRSFSKTFF